MNPEHVVAMLAAIAAILGAWLELRRGDLRELVRVLEVRVELLEKGAK